MLYPHFHLGVVQLSDFHRDLTEFKDEEDEAEVEAADTKRGRSNKKRRRRKEWSDDDDDDDDEEDNGSSTGDKVIEFGFLTFS